MGHREILGGDGYNHFIDCGDGFICMCVYMYTNTYQTWHPMYMQFITYQFNHNKILKNICLLTGV